MKAIQSLQLKRNFQIREKRAWSVATISPDRKPLVYGRKDRCLSGVRIRRDTLLQPQKQVFGKRCGMSEANTSLTSDTHIRGGVCSAPFSGKSDCLYKLAQAVMYSLFLKKSALMGKKPQ